MSVFPYGMNYRRFCREVLTIVAIAKMVPGTTRAVIQQQQKQLVTPLVTILMHSTVVCQLTILISAGVPVL